MGRGGGRLPDLQIEPRLGPNPDGGRVLLWLTALTIRPWRWRSSLVCKYKNKPSLTERVTGI